MFSFFSHTPSSFRHRTEVILSRQVIDNDDVDNDEALVSAASDTLEISFGDITIPIEAKI